MMEANHNAPYARLAVDLARALIALEFQRANQFLSPSLRAALGHDLLRWQFEAMIGYGGGPATEAMLMTTLESWLDRQSRDLGWAHVAIVGAGFSEAVTVIVEAQGQGACICHLERGRP